MKNKETLEEAADKYVDCFEFGIAHPRRVAKNAFINGAKWQQKQDKKMYSEEEVLKFSEWFAFELTHYGYPTEENIIKALKEIKRILKTI